MGTDGGRWLAEKREVGGHKNKTTEIVLFPVEHVALGRGQRESLQQTWNRTSSIVRRWDREPPPIPPPPPPDPPTHRQTSSHWTQGFPSSLAAAPVPWWRRRGLWKGCSWRRPPPRRRSRRRRSPPVRPLASPAQCLQRALKNCTFYRGALNVLHVFTFCRHAAWRRDQCKHTHKTQILMPKTPNWCFVRENPGRKSHTAAAKCTPWCRRRTRARDTTTPPRPLYQDNSFTNHNSKSYKLLLVCNICWNSAVIGTATFCTPTLTLQCERKSNKQVIFNIQCWTVLGPVVHLRCTALTQRIVLILHLQRWEVTKYNFVTVLEVSVLYLRTEDFFGPPFSLSPYISTQISVYI